MNKKQNQRTTGKEQYYTPEDAAQICFKTIEPFLPKSKNLKWLEPAGGTGAFINVIRNHGYNDIISYDIEPKHPDVQHTEDFLTLDLSNLNHCITLTNPPFGRANKLSIPFFNKCALVSDYIGFLIPKSWRKWTVINRLDSNFHLVTDIDLDVDFIYDEDTNQKSKGKLNTIFQVWERREYKREKIVVENREYIKKTTPENADVSLTIFGRGCGKVKTEFERVPNTTQMFLKLNNVWVLEALRTVDFSRFYNNVAFVEALSIQEINYLLNEFHDGHIKPK
jgi:hypothetical protein